MANKSTFIKLDRNIQNWQWYKDGNTTRVFIHILLNSNIKDNGFMGVTIKRGSLATSYASVGEQTNLSIKQVRTALEHLKSTGEITVVRHSKFQVISIINYSLYQDNTAAIKGQSKGNQSAIKGQQYKNTKNGKKEKKSAEKIPDGFSSLEEYKQHIAELRK